MKIKHISKNVFVREVRKKLRISDSVLDIGCGIRPQGFIKPRIHICCEPYKPYVQELKKINDKKICKKMLIIQASWSEVVRLFPLGSVDTIFLLDVVEHLEKEEGRLLLEETIPIARKNIVVFTPLGFLEQSHPDGKDAWGFDGGKWQELRSGWEPKDFGDDWESLVIRDYHQEDNLGKKYEVPKGALLAIYTVNKNSLIDKLKRYVSFKHK